MTDKKKEDNRYKNFENDDDKRIQLKSEKQPMLKKRC